MHRNALEIQALSGGTGENFAKPVRNLDAGIEKLRNTAFVLFWRALISSVVRLFPFGRQLCMKGNDEFGRGRNSIFNRGSDCTDKLREKADNLVILAFDEKLVPSAQHPRAKKAAQHRKIVVVCTTEFREKACIFKYYMRRTQSLS